MPAFHSGLESFNCAESRQGDRGIMSLKFVFSPHCPFLPPLSLRRKRVRTTGCGLSWHSPRVLCTLGPSLGVGSWGWRTHTCVQQEGGACRFLCV